jgi:hypothetical protein
MDSRSSEIVISAIIVLIFALPMILSKFIYLGIAGSYPWFSMYFILYIIACVFFISLSAVLFFIKIFAKKNYTKNILTLIGTISGVLIIMFLLNVVIIAVHKESEFIIGANYNKFNSAKWQKADYNNVNQREYILKDLVQNILPNKNIIEILNILGEPHAIVSDGKTYYPYSENGDMIFRSSERDENEKAKDSGLLDVKDLYQSEIKKEIMIYYITGPAFIDHSTLNIYFGENCIFKEYKLGSS